MRAEVREGNDWLRSTVPILQPVACRGSVTREAPTPQPMAPLTPEDIKPRSWARSGQACVCRKLDSAISRTDNRLPSAELEHSQSGLRRADGWRCATVTTRGKARFHCAHYRARRCRQGMQRNRSSPAETGFIAPNWRPAPLFDGNDQLAEPAQDGHVSLCQLLANACIAACRVLIAVRGRPVLVMTVSQRPHPGCPYRRCGRLKDAPDDDSVRTDDVVILIALSAGANRLSLAE
jgi:hypothetical protein